jgi:hypothetical protein
LRKGGTANDVTKEGLQQVEAALRVQRAATINSGTDVTHFFERSSKVGQRRPDYREVSIRKIDAGSPGWIRTSDHSINSQLLFHFAALQGISPKLRSALFH